MEETKNIFKITAIMPTESGVSQTSSNEWKSREFVVEEVANVQYPNQLVLRTNGDKVKLLDGVAVGDKVEIGFNSRVRSFQTKAGKTVNMQENNCWRISAVKESNN